MLNVHGLGNRIKRHAIFNYFKDYQLDVILVQETHGTEKSLPIWQSEWGRKIYAAQGTSSVRGAAILLNPKSQITVKKSHVGLDGRVVVCQLCKDNSEFTVCNIYAPNTDSPEFFRSIFKVLKNFKSEHCILRGDFNLVLDTELDQKNSKYNNFKAQVLLKSFVEENDLCDIWRMRNPKVE